MWSGFLRHVSPEGFEKEKELHRKVMGQTPQGLLRLCNTGVFCRAGPEPEAPTEE